MLGSSLAPTETAFEKIGMCDGKDDCGDGRTKAPVVSAIQ